MVITKDIITTNANEEQRLGKKLFSCIVAIKESFGLWEIAAFAQPKE